MIFYIQKSCTHYLISIVLFTATLQLGFCTAEFLQPAKTIVCDDSTDMVASRHLLKK